MFLKKKYKQIRHWIELLHGRYLFHTKVAIPWDARTEGEPYIQVGKNCVFHTHLWLEAVVLPEDDTSKKPKLILGDRVSIGEFVHIGAAEQIVIGNDVLMGSKILITDHNHGSYTGSGQSSPQQPPVMRRIASAPVMIGNRVWIGENVVILPGVTIGEGAIIGAMSTVTHDIPSNTIAVGNPACVIKRWDEAKQRWIPVKSDVS